MAIALATSGAPLNVYSRGKDEPLSRPTHASAVGRAATSARGILVDPGRGKDLQHCRGRQARGTRARRVDLDVNDHATRTKLRQVEDLATSRPAAGRAAPHPPRPLKATTEAIMTRKPAPIAVPSAKSTVRWTAPDHQRAEQEDRLPGSGRCPASRERTSDRTRRGEHRPGVKREPLAGWPRVVSRHRDWRGREAARPRAGKLCYFEVPSCTAAEQQCHQAKRSSSQTHRHLLHRELPLAMHLRLHRYG